MQNNSNSFDENTRRTYIESVWNQFKSSPATLQSNVGDYLPTSFTPESLSTVLGNITLLRFRDLSRRTELEERFGKSSIKHFESIYRLTDLNRTNDVTGTDKIAEGLVHGEEWLSLCGSLLSGNGLYCLCPWTGKKLESDKSLLFTSDNWGVPRYSYYFESVQPFYITVSGHVLCQLLHAYFPAQSLVVNFSEPVSSTNTLDSVAESLRAFLINNTKKVLSYLASDAKSERRRAVLLASYHYAHHLWNELSAIEGLKKHLTDDLVLFVTNSPFGPVNHTFPDISDKSTSFRYGVSIGEIAIEALERNLSWAPIGRLFIPCELTERIKAKAIITYPKDRKFSLWVRSEHELVIWVTTRQDVRIWVNQVDAISEIIKFASSKFRSIAIIFDGYTPGYRGLVSSKTLEKENSIIREIYDKCLYNVTCISLIGARLDQSIVWAEIADIYIANHGTIQHKIGWFYSLPGVCHYCPPEGFLPERFSALRASPTSQLPTYVYGKAVSAGRTYTDPRKDLSDYTIENADLLCAFSREIDKIENNRSCSKPSQKSFHHITESYYEMGVANEYLALGDADWARGDVVGAIENYALGLKTAPKYLRMQRRFIEFVLMNFISWFSGSDLAEARVAAIRFILVGINPNNSWAKNRLLDEILVIQDFERFQLVLKDIATYNPVWKSCLTAQFESLIHKRHNVADERIRAVSQCLGVAVKSDSLS